MAVDYFLKLDGIEGESKDNKHLGEIDIESFSWGETQPGTLAFGTGGGAGKVQMQDFHFTMYMSKASPTLFLKCATGEHIKSAILSGDRVGDRALNFLKWRLSDVILTSYQTGGTGGDALPTESISMNFAKIEVEYTVQKEDGSAGETTSAGWDVRLNQKV